MSCAHSYVKEPHIFHPLQVFPCLDELFIYNAIQLHYQTVWRSDWFHSMHSRFLFQVKPLPDSNWKFVPKIRSLYLLLNQLRSNNTYLNASKFKLKKHPTGNCDICLVLEDCSHFIGFCTHPNSAASALRITLSLPPTSNINIPVSELLDNPFYCDIIIKAYKKRCLLYLDV